MDATIIVLIRWRAAVEGFPEKKGTLKFGSTSITLKDTGKVMQTPPGNGMSDAAYNWDPRPMEYTGKTSCSNCG